MMKRHLRLIPPLLGMGLAILAGPALAAAPGDIDSGNTSWLLVSAALVMLMTPGLAFFYAGMVNHKNVVSTLLQNFIALPLIGLVWIIVGYSLVFTAGSSLAMPSCNLLLLDLFPANRGMASSLQGFLQFTLSGIVAGTVAPFAAHSLATLALTMTAFTAAGLAVWLVYQRRARAQLKGWTP